MKKSNGITAQAGRFGLVGVLNTVIDFGVLNLLVLFFSVSGGGALLLCNAVSFTTASLNSYLMNRKWTFCAEGKASSGQYLFFLVFALGGLVVNSLVLYLLVRFVPVAESVHPLLRVNAAKACATAAGMTWNFLTFRFIVFHRTSRALSQGRRLSDGKV